MKSKPASQFGRPAITIQCPGCRTRHVIPVRGDTEVPTDPRATWRFNGSYEKPTLDPSVRIEYPHPDASSLTGKASDAEARVMVTCHFNLTSGRIHYHGDCTHKLAGRSVDLQKIE